MNRATQSRSRRSLVRLSSFLVASSVALVVTCPTAMAGPVSPNHRFEHIGRAVGDVAAVLQFPGYGRALVLTHYGDLILSTGDRLVTDVVHHIDVSQMAPGDGILDATWHSLAPGTILYVSYIQPTPRKLAVARLEFTKDRVTDFDVLYSVTIPPTATMNFGGGIAMGSDMKLYLGVGDMGNMAGAQQPTTLQGKIFRINSDLPGGVPTDNPISPTSPVYAMGVRNPMRIAVDSDDGTMYFIDLNTTNDEVNVLQRAVNYGWSRFTGRVGSTGFTDPIFAWATSITPTGLEVNRGSNFGLGMAGDLLISTAGGKITSLHPNGTALATETVLLNAGTGDPGSYADLDIRKDGYAYVSDGGGDIWRLRNNSARVQEPSDRESITPMLLRKLTSTQLEFTIERETAVIEYGLYTGDIRQSWVQGRDNWYSHGLTSTDTHAVDGNQSDAWTRFTKNMTGMPTVAYFLASAANGREETGLGVDFDWTARPGGNQVFGCPCPDGAPIGPYDQDYVDQPGLPPNPYPGQLQCGPDFSVAQGVEGRTGGVPNHTGPYNIPADYDCMVVFIDLSAEWCGPCRGVAAGAEAIYQEFKDRGFVMIHAVNERSPRTGAPCDLACAERWSSDFNATFPVLADMTSAGWDAYNVANAWPQAILIARDGSVAERWLGGYPDSVYRAAIDAELSR